MNTLPLKRTEQNDTLAPVIYLKFDKAEHSDETAIRALSQKNALRPCFRTDHRYFCRDSKCLLNKECKKLIAVWLR